MLVVRASPILLHGTFYFRVSPSVPLRASWRSLLGRHIRGHRYLPSRLRLPAVLVYDAQTHFRYITCTVSLVTSIFSRRDSRVSLHQTRSLHPNTLHVLSTLQYFLDAYQTLNLLSHSQCPVLVVSKLHIRW